MRDASPQIVTLLIATAFVTGHIFKSAIERDIPAEKETTASEHKETARRPTLPEMRPAGGHILPPPTEPEASANENSATSAPMEPVEFDRATSASATLSPPGPGSIRSLGRTAISEPLYRVQLGAFRVASNAESARRRILRLATPLIDPVGLDVATKENNIYILRTHKAMGQTEADGLCARLRARTLTCFVTRGPV